VAEPDLNEDIETIKRATRAELEWEVFYLRNQLRLYRLVCPYPDFSKSLRPFLVRRGRPKRTGQKREEAAHLARLPLVVALHKHKLVLNNNLAFRKSDSAIAKLLRDDPRLRTQKGKLPELDYLRQLIGKLIRFVVEMQLGPAPPGREKRKLRDRAIDRILGDKVELASYQQAKLKK